MRRHQSPPAVACKSISLKRQRGSKKARTHDSLYSLRLRSPVAELGVFASSAAAAGSRPQHSASRSLASSNDQPSLPDLNAASMPCVDQSSSPHHLSAHLDIAGSSQRPVAPTAEVDLDRALAEVAQVLLQRQYIAEHLVRAHRVDGPEIVHAADEDRVHELGEAAEDEAPIARGERRGGALVTGGQVGVEVDDEGVGLGDVFGQPVGALADGPVEVVQRAETELDAQRVERGVGQVAVPLDERVEAAVRSARPTRRARTRSCRATMATRGILEARPTEGLTLPEQGHCRLAGRSNARETRPARVR